MRQKCKPNKDKETKPLTFFTKAPKYRSKSGSMSSLSSINSDTSNQRDQTSMKFYTRECNPVIRRIRSDLPDPVIAYFESARFKPGMLRESRDSTKTIVYILTKKLYLTVTEIDMKVSTNFG